MSVKQFEEDSFPVDHPQMVLVRKLWEQQSIETKKAWHRVTCLNSRDGSDLDVAGKFISALTDALRVPTAVHDPAQQPAKTKL